VPNISRQVVQAVNFGRSIADDVRAVHVTEDADAATAMREAWERQIPGVPLIIVESPYRSLVVPFLAYLDVVAPETDEAMTIVIVPEYVASHWWERILYNQTSNWRRSSVARTPSSHRSASTRSP
jgi:hypothetical protein